MFSDSWGFFNLSIHINALLTADTRYTRCTTDYRHSHGLVMFPFRTTLCWICFSWDFLLCLALQPRYQYRLAPRQLKNYKPERALREKQTDRPIARLTTSYCAPSGERSITKISLWSPVISAVEVIESVPSVCVYVCVGLWNLCCAPQYDVTWRQPMTPWRHVTLHNEFWGKRTVEYMMREVRECWVVFILTRAQSNHCWISWYVE